LQKVLALFRSGGQAEEAIRELKARDFAVQDISVVASSDDVGGQGNDLTGRDHQNLANGTVAGGAIGGLTGLLAGVGALLIPGLGPIIAAGPLAGALTGIVTGGIAGGLIDYGLPEAEGRRYEEEISRGNVLVAVETDDENLSREVIAVFRENGAQEVKTHL